MIYTVIGSYLDSGLKYLGHVEANSPLETVQITADQNPDDSIRIAAVIEGRHVDAFREGFDYVDDTDDFREQL